MKKVLFVEDDPFIVDIYSSHLRSEGYTVDIAKNLKMAEEKVKSGTPDIVILDLNLNPNFPGPKDGLDILRNMRQNPVTKSLKVIVFSNYSLQDYPELSELSHLDVAKTLLKVESTPEEMSNTIKELFR